LAVRKLLLLGVFVALALAPAAAARPFAAPATPPGCDLPAQRPLWIDFGDGSVPFWQQVFARPGIIAAASNFLVPPKLRAAGAKTVYWDMHLNNRVGTPQKPLDPAGVTDQADRLYLRAVASSGCATPVIALNELFGAGTATPWSDSNTTYRANVLTLLRRLSALGARPYLLISSPPYTGGDAGQWWRDASQVADLVREVYFSGPRISKQGPLLGSRTMRDALRKSIEDFTEIGIPPSGLGVMLGFHTTKGIGSGREGLQPASAWFDVVKLEALAARQVAGEESIGSVWSWGWGVWSAGEADPDKEAAACVWLWARDASLCDGPKLAGEDFDLSRTEGLLPAGVQCALGPRVVTRSALAAVTKLTGDPDAALSALQERLVLGQATNLTSAELNAAEAQVVDRWFGGRFSRYQAALARAGISRSLARSIIDTQARELKIRRSLHVAAPSSAEILDWYTSYAGEPARVVDAKPAPWWLGRRTHGVALSATAPAVVLTARPGAKPLLIRTTTGLTRVTVGEPAMPLGAYPLSLATPAISAALVESKQLTAFGTWLLNQQTAALKRTVCVRDQLPSPEPVDLTGFVPFLALA
jgi:hypothetical protein